MNLSILKQEKMKQFNVPKREEVSENNQKIFDQLNNKLGFVPNLYATYAYSDNALQNYLGLTNAPTSLSNKEKEVVNLAVSEVNGCQYCLAVHTAIGKMNGFNEDEIIEFRQGHSTTDSKLNALAAFTKNVVENRGKASDKVVEDLFEAGYSKENLVDTIILIGDKTMSNYLHGTTRVPIDFPAVKSLELV